MKCDVCGGPLIGDGFDHKRGCFMVKPNPMDEHTRLWASEFRFDPPHSNEKEH